VTDSPQALLRRFGLRAKHSWGQNFLAAPDVLEEIARTAVRSPEEPVLELGPGLGHLTRALLATGAAVTAVERDRDMVRVLQAQELPGLRLVEANAASVHFDEVAQAAPVVVVGNLPYHLTSPILFEVLDQHAKVLRAVFTVQVEVADRLSAAPGSRDYGLLSVLLGLHFDVSLLRRLPAQLFHPPPKVDSAVVLLTHRAAPRAPVRDDAHFRQVVKAAFAQRRKTVLNSLKSDPRLGTVTQLSAALSEAGIVSQRRAETLSVEEFAALERALPATEPA
jgi:16S rRNA (adenine1518-N6/adenine1519-N6)-dimethyltransferase